jgi:hypothetical protein
LFAFLCFPALSTIYSAGQSGQEKTDLAAPVQAATPSTSEQKQGTITGTVTDQNGDPVPAAIVELKSADANDHRTIVTPYNGFFQFDGVKPGIPYQVFITAIDFDNWTSPTVALDSGQYKILTNVQLRVRAERTEIQVKYDPVEVATEQLKVEEHQRIFGIIPNFYVSYEKDPAPLTPKMKFELAFKASTDPVALTGIGLLAAAKHVGDTPNYGEGWGAFGKRFGTTAADGFTGIMLSGAILPSLLHQDPRYFYKGTGTFGSRFRHAMSSPFVARGDNGKWQPNYSTVFGDLASSALSNLYYPSANRGAGVVFVNFGLAITGRMGADFVREFILGRLARGRGHIE